MLKENKNFNLAQAIAEANRCLLCHDAPCSAGCPAGTDPGKFIRKLHLRNITGAIRTIKENNILGGVCGALCPASRLCEKECCSTGIDRPIRIGKIQKALIDYAHDINFKTFQIPKQKPQKVAVLGAGPAGISCAAELAKDGFKVTIFEKMTEAGGVLRFGVPGHRLSRELLKKELDELATLGVEIKYETPIDKAENLLEKGYDAVFIAPGLWQAVKLNGKQYNSKNIISSISFLKDAKENKITDFIKDKKVAVIGGGSTAVDCAETALLLGAKDVYLIYRRSYPQMPATDEEKTSALSAGIHFMLLSRPLDYVFDPNGNFKGIKLIRTQLGGKDSSQRRKPIDIPASEWVFDADVVIEAIGQEAETESPKWYSSVKVDKNNLIVINPETGQTSVKNIFAGGDIARGPAFIADAVGDGKRAAKAIIEQLSYAEVLK